MNVTMVLAYDSKDGRSGCVDNRMIVCLFACLFVCLLFVCLFVYLFILFSFLVIHLFFLEEKKIQSRKITKHNDSTDLSYLYSSVINLSPLFLPITCYLEKSQYQGPPSCSSICM